MTDRLLPVGRRVFRSGLATAGGVVAVVVALLLIGDAALRAGAAEATLLAPWILLALWAVYVLAYAPHVATDAEGIRIRNILRVVDAPWRRVADIRLRWALEVTLDDGRVVRAWGGPVAARPPRPGLLRRDAEPAVPAGLRDLEIITDEWEAHRADPSGAAVEVRWDLASLVALAVLVAWAITAVLITGGPRP